MRAALVLTALLLLVGCGEGATSAATFTEPGAQMFTLAGGGPAAPTEGAPARSAKLAPTVVGTTSDGDALFADLRSFTTTTVWRVDPTGRLRRVAAVRLDGRPVGILRGTFAPDGTLVGFDEDDRLLRVAPDGAARVVARFDVADDVSLAADGGYLVASKRRALKVTPEGRVSTLLDVRTGAFVLHVAEAPGGGLVYTRFATPRLFFSTQAPLTSPVRPATGSALLVTPQGFVVSDGHDEVALLARGRAPVTLSYAGGRLEGEGGAPGRTALGTDSFAVAPDGTLLAASDGGIDVIVPPGAQRPVAAIADATLARFAATGAVQITSRIAGEGRVELRDGGRVVASATGPVGVGASTITLPGRPPEGRLILRVTIDGVVRSERSVVTLRTLPLRVARSLADDATSSEGDDTRSVGNRLGRCARISATRVDCQLIEFDILIDDRGRSTNVGPGCTGRLSVRVTAGELRVVSLKGGCRLPDKG